MIPLFESKGFSATDLVALVGAHTAARNLRGQALDSSVGSWDSTFYTETKNGTAPASVRADVNLSNAPETSSTWDGFGADTAAWAAAFVPAYVPPPPPTPLFSKSTLRVHNAQS
jgi:manganese peroxidase